MREVVNGKHWDMVEADLGRNKIGECDAPDTPNKQIRINSRCPRSRHLEAVIHEVTHAFFWNLDEEPVDQFAKDLSRILAKLKYDRV